MATEEAAQVLLDQARLRIAEQSKDVELYRTKGFGIVTVSGIIAALFAPHVSFSGLVLPFRL